MIEVLNAAKAYEKKETIILRDNDYAGIYCD